MNIMKEVIKKKYIDCFPFNSEYDEFQKDYFNEKLFINPPFSKMKEVSEWIIKQLEHRNKIVLLIPARTDTQYFHELIKYSPRIYFIKGRLHYNEEGSAPFPSIILLWEARDSYMDLFDIRLNFYYGITENKIKEIL